MLTLPLTCPYIPARMRCTGGWHHLHSGRAAAHLHWKPQNCRWRPDSRQLRSAELQGSRRSCRGSCASWTSWPSLSAAAVTSDASLSKLASERSQSSCVGASISRAGSALPVRTPPHAAAGCHPAPVGDPEASGQVFPVLVQPVASQGVLAGIVQVPRSLLQPCAVSRRVDAR